VTVAEVASLALALSVAVVALVSLASAHLGVLTGANVAVGSVVLALAVGGSAVARLGRPPRVVVDLPGLVVVLGTLVVAAFFYLPGFDYAVGDKDPGVYVMHGITMARDHSYEIVDPVLRDGLPVQVSSPGARFPGVWIADADTGKIVPQFYHLWPALLATSYNAGGWGLLTNTTPVVGIVATMLAAVVARRVTARTGDAVITSNALSLVASAATGVLLSVNMLQVWQAKYPTAEMLAQLLFTAATLCLLITLQTGWRWAAAVAGALVAIGYLNRADGLLLVLGAIGVSAILYVIGRYDSRLWWFLGGLVVLLPYALWQAYGPAKAYTVVNTSVSLRLLVAAIAVVIVSAVVLRWAIGGFARRTADQLLDRGVQARLGLLIMAAIVALFLFAMARPKLFGPDYALYNGTPQRTFDEVTIYRLAWFLTWPGWLLVLGGLTWVALSRWRAGPWLIAAPLVLLLSVYAWHARNSTYLMWWGRRFVSTVIVGLIIVAAFAIGWLVSRWFVRTLDRSTRLRLVAAGLLLAAPMAAIPAHQSWPVRSHDEWGGTYELERQIAGLGDGTSAVFLWDQSAPCCVSAANLFASPMWLTWQQTSALLPTNPALVPGYLTTYAAHFADRPVFAVYPTGAQPPTVDGLRFTEVAEFAGTLPRWDEVSISRPAGPIKIPYNFVVYRATATGA
jgi:hypothetical protein